MNSEFGLNLGPTELVEFAGLGEKASAGAVHYDNVTASLFGGFVIAPRKERVRPLSLQAPEALRLCLVTPKVALPANKTEYARSLVPRSVPLVSTVRNVSMAAALVAGLAKADIGLIGYSMEDAIVEPARKRMIPGSRH
jgi:homoserine kinase